MLELRDLTKQYKETTAVKSLNITCEEREFLVVFGPAGAGKTTTLKLIAGITAPSAGVVYLGGRNMNGVPPEHRNMSMAFENYNLYSHMTVYENLAFPLRARKMTSSEIDAQVRKMADVLQITPLLERRPGYLSGGQRQRVALGRALVRDADVYLLDEPISHLDAKLRHLMRGELKAICAEKQATVIHVTHDYKEAMALSDRIAVLNKGRLMQIGTPDTAYHQPANEFVASFLGDPPMSFLDANLHVEGDGPMLQSGELRIPIDAQLSAGIADSSPEGKVRVGIRATSLTASPVRTDSCTVPTEVYVVETFGYRNVVTSRAEGAGLVQAVSSPFVRMRPRDTVWLNLNVRNIHLFSASGEAIYHPPRNGNRESRS